VASAVIDCFAGVLRHISLRGILKALTVLIVPTHCVGDHLDQTPARGTTMVSSGCRRIIIGEPIGGRLRLPSWWLG
jgi:hypothetical protein